MTRTPLALTSVQLKRVFFVWVSTAVVSHQRARPSRANSICVVDYVSTAPPEPAASTFRALALALALSRLVLRLTQLQRSCGGVVCHSRVLCCARRSSSSSSVIRYSCVGSTAVARSCHDTHTAQSMRDRHNHATPPHERRPNTGQRYSDRPKKKE